MVKTVVTTPKKSTTEPVQESPGTWRHPRLAEIRKRQEVVTFSERNVKQIAINVCALAALVVLKVLAARTFRWNLPHKCVFTLPEPELPQPGITSNAYLTLSLASGIWGLFVCICGVLLFNIGANFWPLVRTPDDLSDIPLTPGQRRLLGLPPSSRPPTPGSAYSTPPRFSRTPSVGSASSRRSFSTSPASNRGSPINGSGSINGAGGFAGIGSPSSPLLQKAMNGARRSSIGSLGSPSPSLGASLGASLFVPDSPSPNPAAATGKRSSIGLNSKWLYEKGRERRASGNARLFA